MSTHMQILIWIYVSYLCYDFVPIQVCITFDQKKKCLNNVNKISKQWQRQGLNWPSLVTKETSRTRIGLHLIELFSKGAPQNTQTSQTAAKTIQIALHKLTIRPQRLKTTLTQFIDHGEVKLVSTQNLHPSVPVSLVQGSTLQTTKRVTQTSTQPQIL